MKTDIIFTIVLVAAVLLFSGCTDSSSSKSTNGISVPAASETANPNTETPKVETIQTESIDSIKSKATDVPYTDLYRYNENYNGRIVHYRGEVLQVSIEDDLTFWRIATKASEWGGYTDDVIIVGAKDYSGLRLLEGDFVDVWGESKELLTYTAIMGNEITVPLISYLHIELVDKDQIQPPSFIVSERGTLDNPAGISEKVVCLYSNKKYQFSVLDVIRGNKANNLIAEANEFNEEAPTGYEYTFVKVKLDYLEGTDSLYTSSFDFRAFSDSVECTNNYVLYPNSHSEFPAGTLMPGGEKEGWVVYVVPTNEDVLVAYQENIYTQGTACYVDIGSGS